MNDFQRLRRNSLDRATYVIVGVGASAGGFDPFQELLRSLDESHDLAIVFVQHLEKDSDAQLIELLSTATSYKVVSITGRTKLNARTVYVCPPWTLLEMKNGSVRTVENENTDRPNSPIDHFLQSLAEDQGERGIGVILSGLGSDGTLGLKAISDSGGLTFAQSLDSATHDGMPRSAATTGIADHVLAPKEIATELKRYAAQMVDESDHQEQDVIQHIFDSIPIIAKKLLDVTNHNFQHYKQNTLARRIQRRMRILKLASVDAYVKYLEETAEEPHALFRELLISVTAFFRDPEAFEVLTESVLAPLFAERKAEDTVRIWVPGCATGEEAYTLAMLCREQMDKLKVAPEVQIFATDIDERALKISRQATYPIGVEEHISPERLTRFFIKRGKKYQIAKDVRELVLFSAHNLISDPPFSRLDLISCRNLLIYLGPHLQQKLIPLFHYALKPTGFLMLGPSENISAHGDLFQMIDSKHRISRRKDTSVDATEALSLENGKSGVGQLNRPVASVSDTTQDLMHIMQRIVLDEFSPKSVIIEEDGKILCASADMHKYLSVGTGIFQNNILKMARKGLRIGLRAALQEAKAKRRRIVHDDLSVPFEGKLQRVLLTVQPMPRVGRDDELFMVVFQDSGLPLEHNMEDAPGSSHLAGEETETDKTQSIISQLERELTSTRDDLEKTVQEMETTNEELKASNEELLSMNEELQSVIDELASSKEEIRTASMAIGQVNSDLENLLQNTRVATIFVDPNGIIRRFTQSAAEIYNLIPSDIGRSLGDITHKLCEMPPLTEQSVLASATTAIEHEVRSESGRWYLRRVLPNFRDAKIDGMILSFIDITDRKQAAIRLNTENRVIKIIASADSFDTAIPDILRAIRNSLNAQVCSLWLPNHKLESLYCAEICVDSENALLQEFVACSQAIIFEPGIGLPGRVWTTGETHWLEDLSRDANFSRLQAANKSGLISGIAFPIVVGSIIYGVVELFSDVRMEREQSLLDMLHSIGSDIGQFILQRKLDEELRDEEARKTSILEAAIDAIVTMDYEGRIADFNPAAERAFGYTQDEVRGQRLADLIIPEEYREAHTQGLKRFLTTGHSKVVGRRLELTALRKDDSVFPVELAISATQTRDGTPFFTAHMRDITEHKNFLRKIVDSERQIRSLISSTAEGIYGIDLGGNCVFANETCAKLLGYEGTHELLGKQMHELIHHSRVDGTPYPAMECRIYRAYLDCDRVHVDDEVFWRKDGTSFDVEYWSYPQVQETEIVGCVVTFLDITERKIAESKLRASKEQLQLGVEVADLALAQIDYLKGIVTLSREAARLYGLGEDELVTTRDKIHATFHPDERQTILDRIGECLNPNGGGRFSIDHRILLASGEVRWLEVSKHVLFDHSFSPARPVSSILAAHDITASKEQEQRVRESEERLRSAAEAAGFGTVHADLISGKVHYSVEMKRLLGLDYSADELIIAGDIPEWIHHEDRAACAQHFLESTQLPEGSSSKIDHRIVRPNGEIRWIRLQAKPIYTQIGKHRKVTQLIGTILDITQQREFEHSLNEARAIAEAANESKSVFLANMSHEIRTPMTAILGYTDLIADRVQDEQALSHLRTIRRNGYYLLDIINDILDLSKIEAGMLQIDCERFSLSELVEDVRSIMDVRAKEKQLILDVEYQGPVPIQIESDPKRLKQILINLLGNAIKFSEKGSVKLVISYSDMILKFEVIDTGIGISKSQQKRLFQPFSQGDHTVNRLFGGTGLGLVISQRLAALLNGAITVKSERKKGSTFTVTIATGNVTDVEHVVSNSVSGPRDQAPPLVDVQLNCHILVVDDRRDIRFLSRRFLSEAGAKVTEAEDGELALQAVADALATGQEFDLILLDMQMPKLDGYETAKRLRQLHYTGPIIALTADAMHGDMKRCLECGCNNYLSKPIDRTLLMKMVHDYVSAPKKS